ncbi:MAG: O-antigen ligase family protein [Eubacteriales bacterium]|nr:O-antigen ligase family protein [Eubacteriales bacterium]
MFFEMLQQFALGIVSYVFFRYCDDRERLLNDMAVLSVIMTVAMILLPLLAGRGELFDASYSQYYAYMVFPAFIISMNETIRRKSVFYGLVAAVCLVMTFMMGARGPVILELLFVIIRFIDEPIHPLGKVITSVAVAGGGTFIYFNMYTILELLNRLAVSMDFSNRLFKKLVQGTLYDSGRDGIYAAALQMIDRHPLTGVGIGTDRIALARLVNSSNPLGTYSHNFLLDLLVQFGIVIGTVIMIGFIILAVRAFIVSRKTSSGKNIFWVMLMIGFAPLLFSSSYITYPLFFAMLAMWQSDFET